MKALDPPSGRFDKNLRNTRFELTINAKEVKSNHFVQVPIPGVTLLDISIDNNSSTASPGSPTFDGSYLDSPVRAPSVLDTPKGLYAYGDTNISADNLIPKAATSWAPSPKTGSKSPTRRNEHLRPPVVNRGSLPVPVQQAAPPQPMGPIPASLLTPQNSMLFAAKSTSSLLGLQPSLSRSFSELSRTVAVSASEPALPVFTKASQRPKLNSVNLLNEYGKEVDAEHREHIAVQEPFSERPSVMSSVQHGPPPVVAGGGFHFDAPRASSAGLEPTTQQVILTQASSSRPTSPAVQLFDFNTMSRKDPPPAPSTLEKHQQGLSLQMKMAYLHATTSGSTEELSRRSRPNSRAQSAHARNIPLPVATQVFRVPSAVIQEKSFFSSSEADFNPTESIDSLKKIPFLEENSLALTGTKSNLHMDSEMEMTLESAPKSSVEGFAPSKGTKHHKASKSKLKQSSLRASLSTSKAVAHANTNTNSNTNPTPATSKVPGFAGGDALTNSELPAPLSPQLHMLLPPQQLDALQQPHYQDPRFQKNPREVIYKFHGHLLNTTPFPEEIAHLTLHGKSGRLPQYLKAQQEEQQVRYNNKVRVLASMHIHNKPSERLELTPLPRNSAPSSNNPTKSTAQSQLLPAAGLNDMDLTDFVAVDPFGAANPQQDDFSEIGGAMQSMPTGGLFMQDSLSLTSAPSVLNSGKNPKSAKVAEQDLEAASVHSTANESFAGSKDCSLEGAGGSTRSVSDRLPSQSGGRAASPENGRTSPSRPPSRSLSIRLMPVQGMGLGEDYQNTSSSDLLEGPDSIVAVMSDSAPPSAPYATASSAVLTLASSTNSNKIAQGFARAASPRHRPTSATEFEDTLPNTFREDIVITGESPGPKKAKIKTKVSPKRVAYVLNKHPAGEEDHDGRDDQSLHSVHSLQNSVHTSATGNYSAITDDGNFSILKSPPAARKPRGFASADNSHTGVDGRYRPRLDSVAASSLASDVSETAVPMPFQVHRKVMGWKLTSTLQRRRNLVGMLDLVHASTTQDSRLAQSDGAMKRTLKLSQLAAPRQVPHALLRTGHGKRSGHRDVPPLNKVHAHMVEINRAQQELQHTQVSQGFAQSTRMLQDKNFGTTPTLNLSRSVTARSSRNTTPKKHALRASTSQLGNLAIQVETMGKFLPSETPFDSPR